VIEAVTQDARNDAQRALYALLTGPKAAETAETCSEERAEE
jgi:hypothetical protein